MGKKLWLQSTLFFTNWPHCTLWLENLIIIQLTKNFFASEKHNNLLPSSQNPTIRPYLVDLLSSSQTSHPIFQIHFETSQSMKDCWTRLKALLFTSAKHDYWKESKVAASPTHKNMKNHSIITCTSLWV